jgi:2-dehydropantoate 2-reductase
MKKRIAVIGLGGVGGYFGFKLNEANTEKEFEITFLARGLTYQIVKSRGLTLLSPEHFLSTTKPDGVVQSIAELENPDLIVICVKEYDLEKVCQELVGIVTEKTILLPLMNGVDIYDRIRGIIKKGIVLPACVYVASHIKEKGTVMHEGKTGKIILGRDYQHFGENIDWVLRLLQNSGADVTLRDNSFPDIWAKFIFIASFGLVTARYNISIGQVCEEERPKARATAIMEEVKEIACKKGIDFPDDIIEGTFRKAQTFPYHTPTSLQLDVNSNKGKNELELFAGAIIKYGNELRISTTNTAAIYQEIKEIIYK